jgi:hypothetical protein
MHQLIQHQRLLIRRTASINSSERQTVGMHSLLTHPFQVDTGIHTRDLREIDIIRSPDTHHTLFVFCIFRGPHFRHLNWLLVDDKVCKKRTRYDGVRDLFIKIP